MQKINKWNLSIPKYFPTPYRIDTQIFHRNLIQCTHIFTARNQRRRADILGYSHGIARPSSSRCWTGRTVFVPRFSLKFRIRKFILWPPLQATVSVGIISMHVTLVLKIEFKLPSVKISRYLFLQVNLWTNGERYNKVIKDSSWELIKRHENFANMS